MPQSIDLPGLKRLLDRADLQLVEVLPEREYQEEHLPRAVNIPLKKMSREAVTSLDRNRPMIVYCWDDA